MAQESINADRVLHTSTTKLVYEFDEMSTVVSNALTIVKAKLRKGKFLEEWIFDEGSVWLYEKFIPALSNIEKSSIGSIRKKDLLGRGYELLALIQSAICAAPLASLKSYRKALRNDPRRYRIWVYLGETYADIGDHELAIDALSKFRKNAPSLNIEDFSAYSEEDIVKSIALYEKNDKNWTISELMAEGRFKRALEMSSDLHGLEGRMSRAKIYGALNMDQEYVKEWRKIAAMKGKITMGWDNWFFMPHRSDRVPELWELMLGVADRFHGGFVLLDKSLENTQLNKNGKGLSKAARLTIEKNLAIGRKDYTKLVSLSKRYPFWTEIKKLKVIGRKW